MPQRVLWAVLLTMTAVPTIGYAQAAEICNAALASGIRDNYSVFTEQEKFQVYQRRLCDARFSSYQAFRSGALGLKLDIPLAEAVLGLSGSAQNRATQFQESYAKYCETNYYNSQYRDRFTSHSNRVSAVLAESWLECQKVHVNAWMEANQVGVFISVVPQDNFEEFTVTLERKGSVGVRPLVIEGIHPMGTVTCVQYEDGAPIGARTSVRKNKLQLTCKKSWSRSIKLSIDTSDGPSNTVTVPAGVSKIAELEEKLSLQSQALKEAMEALATKERDISRQELAGLGGGRVLALAEVRKGRLVFGTEGVSYRVSGKDGILSFRNPKRLRFVPLLSDASETKYITATHFVLAIGDNNVTVRSKALDTEGESRTSAPSSFTAVVIGFESQ